MISFSLTMLAFLACNPPIDDNEGPAIKFQAPEDGAIVNGGSALSVEIRLVDRDGEDPMSLSLSSEADGVIGEATDLANFDVATFTLENPTSGTHVLTAVSTDIEGATQTKSIEFTVNATPSAPVLKVSPENPVTTDDLSGDMTTAASDPEGSLLAYSWEWVNTDTEQTFTGFELPAVIHSSFSQRGETWTFTVLTTEAHEVDGVLMVTAGGISFPTTVTTVIANSLPTAPGGLTVAPAAPTPIDDLICEATGSSSDADGDAISFDYAWEADDGGTWVSVASGSTLEASLTQADTSYRCVLRAFDGLDYSDSLTAELDVGSSRHDVDLGSVFVSGSGADRHIGEHGAGAVLDGSTPRDLLIALPAASDFATDGGWVALFDGVPASGVTELAANRSLGGTTGLFFGSPLQPIGDVDGDGVGELLVGAAGDPGTLSPIVLVVPGASLTASHTTSDTAGLGFVTLLHDTGSAEEGFGHAVAAGDVSGNGESDVFVSHLRTSAKNQIHIFGNQELSPNTSVTTSAATQITASDSTHDFGAVMTSGADITGDGLHDLVVSNPTATDGKAIYVFDASQLTGGNLSAGSAAVRIGTDGDHAAGRSLSLGDINGDSVADLVIGAPTFGAEGAVFIFYGGSGLASGPDLLDADVIIQGEKSGDAFGSQVQVLPDRGADGLDELLISAPLANGTSGDSDAGRVYAFLGSQLASASTHDAADADIRVGGEDPDDNLSLSGPLGDLDGDGYDDWLAVSPSHGDVDPNEGRLYLFLSGY
jgi:hypothetical protein